MRLGSYYVGPYFQTPEREEGGAQHLSYILDGTAWKERAHLHG